MLIVPDAGHVDLYDRVELIPFSKLTAFLRENLKLLLLSLCPALSRWAWAPVSFEFGTSRTARSSTAIAFQQSSRQVCSAVLAMSLCAFALVASEFLPVSLLTPIASDLSLTEGQAGQAISISGFFAVITSLLLATLTQGIDRKPVLLATTSLMLVSGAMVAFAPNYLTLMAGRAVLGIAIGGYWCEYL